MGYFPVAGPDRPIGNPGIDRLGHGSAEHRWNRGGPQTEVTEYGYQTTGSESGIIDMDGLRVHFFEFEPIIDNLSTLNRKFTIGTPGSQTIRLANSTANAGMSTIKSGGTTPAFESLTFTHPAGMGWAD